jgi:recombination protein RecA
MAKKNGRLAALLSGELVGKIQKKHGEMSLLLASDIKVQKIPRIPCGILEVDYALGGGFPVGRISTMYGQKSSGKTTNFLRAIANAQRMCSNCYQFLDEKGKCCKNYREFVIAFLDVEGALDLEWAGKLGVSREEMIVSVPEYAEEALDIGEALIRSGEVDILVLDSIAFLVPMKEIENSVEKDSMGQQPRLVGKGIRKFVAAMNAVGKEDGRRPTVFFTNQIRYKLGVMFGNPETQPGGQGPGFAASVEMKCMQRKVHIDDFTHKPLTGEFEVRTDKNKTYSAKIVGHYSMVMSDTKTRKAGDVNDELAYIQWGEKCGLVTRDKGYNCLGENFRIKADLQTKLETNPKFKKDVYNALLPLMLNL